MALGSISDLCSIITSPSPTLTFLPLSYKDNIPISESLTESHLQSPFCHEGNIHRCQGLGCGLFGEATLPPTTATRDDSDVYLRLETIMSR